MLLVFFGSTSRKKSAFLSFFKDFDAKIMKNKAKWAYVYTLLPFVECLSCRTLWKSNKVECFNTKRLKPAMSALNKISWKTSKLTFLDTSYEIYSSCKKVQKNEKSRFGPVFGVRNTQRLVKIYTMLVTKVRYSQKLLIIWAEHLFN